MLLFPFKDFSNFSMDITLNKKIFIFKFHWNTVSQIWMMSIYKDDSTPLLLNKTLRINNEHLSSLQYNKEAPQGALYVISHDGKDNRITQHDFFKQKAFIAFKEV